MSHTRASRRGLASRTITTNRTCLDSEGVACCLAVFMLSRSSALGYLMSHGSNSMHKLGRPSQYATVTSIDSIACRYRCCIASNVHLQVSAGMLRSWSSSFWTGNWLRTRKTKSCNAMRSTGVFEDVFDDAVDKKHHTPGTITVYGARSLMPYGHGQPSDMLDGDVLLSNQAQ